jgi:hypothetical protein
MKNTNLIFIGALFFLVLSVKVDADIGLTYLQSVPNSAEHWNEIRTPYNEDNKGKLYELSISYKNRNNPFDNIRTDYYFSGGHIINSFYDHTDIIQAGSRACVGDAFRYCWAFGVIGFKGYKDAPKMLDGFFYAPSASHDVQIHAKGFTGIYRQVWLVSAVSSEFFGVGYDFRF